MDSLDTEWQYIQMSADTADAPDWQLVETSVLFKSGCLGDAVASLTSLPQKYLSEDLALLSASDDHDNAAVSYGPDSRGFMYHVQHRRKKNWKLQHDCQAFVRRRQVQIASAPGDAHWTCATCTYINMQRSLHCEMCGAASQYGESPLTPKLASDIRRVSSELEETELNSLNEGVRRVAAEALANQPGAVVESHKYDMRTHKAPAPPLQPPPYQPPQQQSPPLQSAHRQRPHAPQQRSPQQTVQTEPRPSKLSQALERGANTMWQSFCGATGGAAGSTVGRNLGNTISSSLGLR